MTAARPLLLAALLLASFTTLASGDLDSYSRETKSRFDPRVRIVEYNPLAIVTIKQALGYATHIQFAPGEEVEDVSAGDSLAWEVAPSRNHLFLKPREVDGRTNVSIVTNVRPYQFVVDVLPKEKLPDSEMALFVIFMYPDDPQAAEAKIVQTGEVEAMRAALSEPASIRNTDYEACRKNSQINPETVWDDGRFTYMRFRTGQSLPTVQAVLSDGQPAIVNYRMGGQEGDGEADSRTMIIFETASRFAVRYGKSESCIINRSAAAAEPLEGGDSGSTRRGLRRIFRGGN